MKLLVKFEQDINKMSSIRTGIKVGLVHVTVWPFTSQTRHSLHEPGFFRTTVKNMKAYCVTKKCSKEYNSNRFINRIT